MVSTGKLLNSTAFSSPPARRQVPEVVHSRGRTMVRQNVDLAIRRCLIELAEQSSAGIAHDLRRVLARGPSKGGAKEAREKFGITCDVGDPVLLRTVQLVEWLDGQLLGIKRWLEVTGFGNDAGMIKVFVDWGEAKWPSA